jgi:putative hydrolase of the HAD superfamily
MEYKDLFIDFDDTLYDTHGNAVIALSETFEYFHLDQYFDNPQVFYDAYWTANIDLWTRYAKGEITRDYLIEERFRRPLMVSEKFRAACEEPNSHLLPLTSYLLKISDKFLDFCASKPGVIDGAHELMDYLKRKGYRMHMCSNGFHEVQYKKLAACGLRDYFDTIILSEDAGVNKPSPLYFDYALKVSGANKETTLMIGDNLQSDIIGAHNAGLDTILFNRWNDNPSSIPTHTVVTLREIMGIL